MTTAVEVPVPGAVDKLRLLDRVDYADCYAVDTTSTRTPEHWMRGLLEDAPRWFQLPWQAGLLTAVLGLPLRLGSPPGTVLGWQILRNEPDVFVVGIDSPRGVNARLIALTPPRQALIATQARFSANYMRTLWPPVQRLHRFFVPYLLTRATHGPGEPERHTPAQHSRVVPTI